MLKIVKFIIYKLQLSDGDIRRLTAKVKVILILTHFFVCFF